MNVQNLKGFRDFLPAEARKRQYVINTLRGVFESYGFEPLETPVLEYEDLLMGKYGDEGEKLMYRFTDHGGRRVAMRYDQTVPLARIVTQYQSELPLPFKRYQIQPVWRADNTQKGRFREFLQCDIDTIGMNTVLVDAELIAVVATAFQKLGFKSFKIFVNDRNIFSKLVRESVAKETDISPIIRAIDKIKKVGSEKVLEEIRRLGYNTEQATLILESIQQAEPTARIIQVQEMLAKQGIDENIVIFDSTLARGLDYYTEIIMEVEIDGYSAGSVAGGGRYDNLIGMFGNQILPANGLAFGFDRILDAMEELNLFPDEVKQSKAQVLITNIEEGLLGENLELAAKLREAGINAEVYLNPHDKLEKQLKYADKKQIPYVVIMGPDEAREDKVTLKNLATREQKTVGRNELAAYLTA